MVTSWDILGAVGAASGIPSLGWQLFTWRASGPKIEVVTKYGFPTYGDRLGSQHLCITAVNTGRADATIASWGIRLPDGSNFILPRQLPWSTQLPAVIAPQSSRTFYIELVGVIELSRARGVEVSSLRPWIQLATGKEVFGKALSHKEG